MSRRKQIYDLEIDHARNGAHRGLVATIGALVVLFNVLAATVLGASAQAGSPLLAGSADDGIVICTGAGMIVVDHDGKPIQGKGGPAHKALCPFCLPLMQGHAKAPDPVAIAPERAFLRTIPVRSHQVARPASTLYACAALPRAPPII